MGANRNPHYWVFAVIIGTLLNTGLFWLLPNLGQNKSTAPSPIIIVDFMQWQEPSKTPPLKTEPKPLEEKSKPKPKLRPKPKIKSRKSQSTEVKSPIPKELVLSEQETQQKTENLPQSPSPEKGVEQAPSIESAFSQELKSEEETLPIPIPLFKLTSTPRFLHKAELIYPPFMQRQGKEATVILEVLIDRKGIVRKVTIAKSGGEEFDRAAIDAIKDSTFVPGNVNGKSVAVLMRLPIKFTLR